MSEVEIFPAAYQVASDIIEAQERELDRLRAELAQARRWAAAWKMKAAELHGLYDGTWDDPTFARRLIGKFSRRRRLYRHAESAPRPDPGKPIL